MEADVAFLFLGETLLIPHLFPVLEALAEREPTLGIDVWVATSMHEQLIRGWIGERGGVRIHRAPGFRDLGAWEAGRNPPLPAKLPLLARLAPRLIGTRVVVVAEQTSLWIPATLPFVRARFIDTFHGAGSMRAKGHWRRRAAWRTLVSSDRERDALIAMGDAPERVAVTGYVKATFRQRLPAARLFDNGRTTVLYTPHWQQHRSSWWAWGPEVVERLAADPATNLIFAPHQRLAERAPDVRQVAESVAHLPHVHCDLDSFATVDGSYTAAADIYLGDTSSQVMEFMARPRPCVFLNPLGVHWRDNASYDQWHCGDVVNEMETLIPAIHAAPARHALFRDRQVATAREALGDVSGLAPQRAVDHIMAALDKSHRITRAFD